MRDLLLALLDMQGHEADAVDSGDAALHRLATSPPPDFVLTDMLMPGIQGGALVRALRGAIGPSTRLVGMSGSRPPQPVLDSLDGFMLKPFGYADLEAALQTVALPHGSSRGSADVAGSVAPDGDGVLDDAIFTSLHQCFQPVQLDELYTMTLSDVEVRRERMAASIDAGDTAATQREAHSIKGLCGMVGARELSGLAGAMEARTTFDVSALEEITAACARLRRMLDTKFANRTAPAGEHE